MIVEKPVYCRRFIGRRQHLDFISERFRAAADGNSSLVLVAGESGSGKTRLVSEFCETLPSPNATCAVGCCFEYARSPFAPFREILRILIDAKPDALRQLGPARRALRFLLPEIEADSGPGGGAESEPDKLTQFAAMLQLLRVLGSLQVTVIVIEDLHWADAATLEFLQYAVPRLSGSRILQIGTFRIADVTTVQELPHALAQLQRNPAVWRLQVDAFSDGEMREFIYHAVDGQPLVSGEVVKAVAVRAEGNPLLAEELLKSAIGSRASSRSGADIPASLRAAVVARMSRFSEDERAVLRSMAVFGRRFEVDFLSHIVQLPVDALLPALKRAAELQLLVEESDGSIHYRFRHAATREAIYEHLLAVEARPLHAKIAKAIEASPSATDRVVQLAYHWWKADEPAAAARYNELAGDEACALYAYQDAATHYERALESRSKSGAQQVEVLEKLARALAHAGSGKRARKTYESAYDVYQAAGNVEDAARVSFYLVRLCSNIGDIDAAFEMARRGLELAQGVESKSLCFTGHVQIARLLCFFRSNIPATVEHLNAAERLLADSSPAERIYFFECRSYVRAAAGQLRDARSDVEEAAAIAAQSGDAENIIRCWSNFGEDMVRRGERSLALEAFDHAFEHGKKRPCPAYRTSVFLSNTHMHCCVTASCIKRAILSRKRWSRASTCRATNCYLPGRACRSACC